MTNIVTFVCSYSRSDTSRCGTSHESRRGTVSSNSSDGSDLFVSSDLCMRGDLLVSPRVSPLLWLKQCVPALVVSASNEDSGNQNTDWLTDWAPLSRYLEGRYIKFFKWINEWHQIHLMLDLRRDLSLAILLEFNFIFKLSFSFNITMPS